MELCPETLLFCGSAISMSPHWQQLRAMIDGSRAIIWVILTPHPSARIAVPSILTPLQGIGQQAVRCVKCNTPVTPFQMVNGYTVVFDDTRQVGLTVHKEAAEQIARSANQFAALPESSAQHSILTYAPHDLVGLAARLRPFLGQLGTTPAVRMPDSHNAGDFGSALIGAPHEYAITVEQLELRTDGHMDIDAVRPGAILLA